MRFRSVVFAVAGLALACGESTKAPVAVALGVVTQPPSSAQSGVALTPAPVVELLDRGGVPVARAGVSVTASIADGGGTLAGPTTRVTDADGRAIFADLVISGTVGPRTLRFSADGLAAATSSSIALNAGPAATLEPASPTELRGVVGAALDVLPSVLIKDWSGNPVPGVAVTFVAASGNGALTGATQSTNSSGVATLGGWTLPATAGAYTIRATVEGFAHIPFTARAAPGLPHAMQPGGDGQSGMYGTSLATPLQVRVLDEHTNPIPGVVVAWSVVSGAGTVEPIDATTDANGIARARYRLGTTPGENVVRASIGAHNLSVDISATARGFSDHIAVAPYYSCALEETGVAYCWGTNSIGQLGDGTTVDRWTPRAIGGSLRFRQISVGFGTSCALTNDDVAYCWGGNGFVALGDGSTVNYRTVPTPVIGGLRFKEIGTGGRVTCGLTTAGAAYCWGANDMGQLGVGSATVETCTTYVGPNSFPCSRSPRPVAGGLTFASIAVAGSHVCALTAAGELYCWGQSLAWGGTGTGGIDYAPVRAATGFTFSKITVGAAYTCGIVAPSSTYCWGAGNYGVLGTGSTDNQSAPVLLPSVAAAQIDGGNYGTCAVATDGRAFCWGYNEKGGVGDGTTTQRLTPTEVSGGLSFTAITTSGYHACGRTVARQVYCWGDNVLGELGVGVGPDRLTPTLARP